MIRPTSGRGETDKVTTRTLSRAETTLSVYCLYEGILLFLLMEVQLGYTLVRYEKIFRSQEIFLYFNAN